MSSQSSSLGARLLGWYRTPAGLLSLGFIVAVVALTVLGQLLIAVIVLTAWVAFLVPYKLILERRDWQTAIDRSDAAVQRRVDDAAMQLKVLEAEVARIHSEMALNPSIEEIVTWQTSVESTQTRMNEALWAAHSHTESLLDQMQTSVDELKRS